MDPTADCAERKVQSFGDITVAEALNITKNHRLAELLR
jgi:hypothetical protein